VHPDITPNQQMAPAPLNPLTVRDRLNHLLFLLGVAVQLKVTKVGPHQAIAFTPLWVPDADKLAKALDKVPEVHLGGLATKEEATTR
jgi:hypothetical protein